MTDIQIAQQAAPLPIGDIAAACGIDPQYLEQYGRYKAKIDYRLLRDRADRPDGKLILVTAITPTPPGRGKPPPPWALPTACGRSAKTPWPPCGSRPWGRCSA